MKVPVESLELEKKTALNICANKSSTKLSEKVESIEEVIAEAIYFIGSC